MNAPKVDACIGTDIVDITTVDVECQTDVDEDNVCVSCHTLGHDAEWNHEVIN